MSNKSWIRRLRAKRIQSVAKPESQLRGYAAYSRLESV
jgi:hypothetical protein